MILDKTPFGKNGLSSKSIFEERKFYKQESIESISNFNVKKVPFNDFWSDKRLYGLVDPKGHVIFPRARPNKFPTLVAKRFQELSDYFSRGIASGFLNVSESPYIQLNIVNSKTVTLEDKVNKNIESLSERINFFLTRPENSEKVKTLEDFLEFIISLYENGINLNLSLSSIILNSPSRHLNSGFCIEVATNSPDDDNVKYEKFLSDTNFAFFSECCLRHGFFIDENIPWRIYFDIKHPYNIAESESIFEEEFERVYHKDLEFVKQQLLTVWNDYARKSEYIIEHTQGLFNTEKRIGRRLTAKKFPAKMDMNFWLRLYTLIRTVESNYIDPVLYRGTYLRAQEIYKVSTSTREERAIESIEEEFKVFSEGLTEKISGATLTTREELRGKRLVF